MSAFLLTVAAVIALAVAALLRPTTPTDEPGFDYDDGHDDDQVEHGRPDAL